MVQIFASAPSAAIVIWLAATVPKPPAAIGLAQVRHREGGERNAAAKAAPVACCPLAAGAAAMPPRRRGSCRAWLSHERALDQPGKQGGTEGDRLIIEVVAVVVHGCT